MEALKGRKSRFCCFWGGGGADNEEKGAKTSQYFRRAQLMASFNYSLLLVYAVFTLSSIAIDPANQVFMAVCLIVGCANVGTFIIGNVGVFLRVDSAIRGSFTLLMLEHIIGFIIGSLLLIESLTTSPLTEYHHGNKVAAYFLTKSRPLAFSLACFIICVSFLGCYTITSVVEWQTEVEAERYAKEHHETEYLIKKSLNAGGGDQSGPSGKYTAPPVPTFSANTGPHPAIPQEPPPAIDVSGALAVDNNVLLGEDNNVLLGEDNNVFRGFGGKNNFSAREREMEASVDFDDYSGGGQAQGQFVVTTAAQQHKESPMLDDLDEPQIITEKQVGKKDITDENTTIDAAVIDITSEQVAIDDHSNTSKV